MLSLIEVLVIANAVLLHASESCLKAMTDMKEDVIACLDDRRFNPTDIKREGC